MILKQDKINTMKPWARFSYEGVPPLTPRERLRSILRDSYLSVAALRNHTPGGLRCIYCHYVFDDQIADFRRICATLVTMGKFVDSDTCLSMLRGEMPIDGSYYHLSFDDGFRNILNNAVPILNDFSIPATIFVPTAMVEADYETIRRYCVKTTRYAAPIEVLTWRDLAELQRAGFTIGSHTRTHARFSTLRGPDLQDEIALSKAELEQKLGSECRYISWPYGTLSDASDEALAFVRKSGYSGCFGSYRGAVRPRSTDPFSIPRHHFEPSWPLSHVRLFATGGLELRSGKSGHSRTAVPLGGGGARDSLGG